MENNERCTRCGLIDDLNIHVLGCPIDSTKPFAEKFSEWRAAMARFLAESGPASATGHLMDAGLTDILALAMAEAYAFNRVPVNCTDCDAPAIVANDSEPGGRPGPKCTRHAHPQREIVTVGWDGASRPIRRYRDELHLPDHLRSAVAPPSDAR